MKRFLTAAAFASVLPALVSAEEVPEASLFNGWACLNVENVEKMFRLVEKYTGYGSGAVMAVVQETDIPCFQIVFVGRIKNPHLGDFIGTGKTIDIIELELATTSFFSWKAREEKKEVVTPSKGA